MHISRLHDPFAPTHELRDYSRILLGLVAIALGSLYLLEAADTLDAGRAIEQYWPVVVIAVGLFQLAERSRPEFGPLLVTAVGVVLLLETSDAVGSDIWRYVWPTALILGGAVIIARWQGAGAIKRGASADDVVLASGIFGGPSVSSASQEFRGASLTAIFGGVTLDIRNAKPVPEGAAITATAAFGGIDILVPHGWRVVVKANPIFGGVEDKSEHESDLPADAPVLRVDALAAFGGVEIKHEK